ncbi:response regulator [Simplicispira suum]|uniref:Response regulator n=1 Tax=Simplicispira suum TaxID=2109915 RepID=A0A2S0N477_9BURK|nr:response regulator [Simplicispira suum]AVO42916.1 response regulator [Simplicispira suum]MBW7833272.1 response regulator [Simplicispira suum]
MSIFDRLWGSARKKTPPPRPTAPAPLTGPSAEPTGSVERRQSPRKNARKGTRALIIDDSPTVVAVLRKALRSVGYETREALDAEHGLALIDQNPPDLIFLDIVLPGMNGFHALRLIRKNPACQHIPVIMISGNEHAIEQFYVNRIGADDFMKKPFSRFEIFARVENLLDDGLMPRRKSLSAPAQASAEVRQGASS